MHTKIYAHMTSGNTYCITYIFFIWPSSWEKQLFSQVSPTSLILPLSLFTSGEIIQDNVQSSYVLQICTCCLGRRLKGLRELVLYRGLTQSRGEISNVQPHTDILVYTTKHMQTCMRVHLSIRPGEIRHTQLP